MRIFIAALLFFTFAFTSRAQETLTLAAAVSRALEKNHALKSAAYDASAATWGTRNAVTNFLPRVELSAGITRIDPQTEARANASIDFIRASASTLGIPPSLLQNIKPFAYRDSYSTGITIVQPIYNGGAEIVGLRAANAMEERSAFALDETRQKVITDVRVAYCEALKMQALVALSRESLERTERWLALTKRCAELGNRTHTDVLRFEVQRASEEGNVVAVENGLAIARMQLNELLGESLDARFTLVDVAPSDSIVAHGTIQSSPNRFASLTGADAGSETDGSITEMHPSLKVMEANLALASAGVDKAWINFKPRVNFAFQYGWEQNNTIALDGIKPWAMSLTFSLPVFNGFGDYTSIQKSEAELDRTREQAEQYRRGLHMQATAAQLAVKATRQRIEVARAALQQANEMLKSVERKFEQGGVSNVELLDVQTAYANAKTNLITSVYDNVAARAKVDQALGKVTP